MKKAKYLLIITLPLIFTIGGCIDGVAVLSMNNDGSGKVTFEGLFDYPAYCAVTNTDCVAAQPFFLGQIKKMLTSGGFAAWDEVSWKLLDGGKYYFKGTAYFKDINKTDFFIGSIKSNLRIVFNAGREPVLELKYLPDDTIPENQQMESLPPALFTSLSINLVINLPADIEEAQNFELLDRQTAMFVIQGTDCAKAAARGRLSEYFRNKGEIKLVLASAGRDLFDYKSQVRYAKKEFEKILNKIQVPDAAQDTEESSLKSEFNSRMRRGLAAEAQKDFNKALEIYENVIDDADAGEKYRAAASYQIGVCLLKMGDKEKAEAQFEYVITNHSLQRNAALKSVKMLQNIRAGKTDEKKQGPKEPPFVIDTIPGLYSQDVDPNTASITITFSEPMKKTDWFYSSFSPLPLPIAADKPSFDPCGVRWTLPVKKLKPGRAYAIAVNYSGNDENSTDFHAGFCGISGQMCENFVLVFATADDEQEPTFIDDRIIEKCDKINFPP